MADIKLDIVNQALTAAGEELLTTLTPGTTMANAAIANYEAIVGEELENGAWKFATKSDVAPTLLTALAAKPLQYQYQLPADLLTVSSVMYGRTTLDGEYIEQAGRILRTDRNSDVTIKYIWRPDEAIWPQRFRRIIVTRLEALFLRTTERYTEAQSRDQTADIKTMVAKHTESGQSRNRPLGEGTLAQARLGGRRRRFY